MKILAIIGTARKSGTIMRLSENLLAGAKERGHETKIVNLYDYEINNCIGCWKCVDIQCPIEDDFSEIFNEILTADIIVLGVPCYWGNVPGVFKSFIDRHTGYAMQKPKNAEHFHEMHLSDKLSTGFRELKRMGPIEGIRNKKYILLSAMTFPAPVAYLSGDYRGLIGSVRGYTKKLKGRLYKKIVYTDTLFQFRKNKEKEYMQKAYNIGLKL